MNENRAVDLKRQLYSYYFISKSFTMFFLVNEVSLPLLMKYSVTHCLTYNFIVNSFL